MSTPVQDLPPFRGHSPDQERPLGGYAGLMGLYALVTGGFAAWFARSGRELPERPGAADLALITTATHKASRLVTKDRVGAGIRAPFTEFQGDTGHGEVDEAARGTGLRRAFGELLICPYCLGVWIATAFSAGMLVAPRATRQVAAVLTIVFGEDLLQIVYARAKG